MRDRKQNVLSRAVLSSVLASLLVPGAVGAASYTVRPGDTLYLIAQRRGVSVDTLRQANGIWTDSLYPGQSLVVPGSGRSTGRGAGYTVQPGDSLFTIAQRVGTTVDALRQANGLWTNDLYPGQTLSLPAGTAGSGARRSYTVEPGDSLFTIAQRVGTTVDALRQANGLWTNELYPGQTISVPGTSGGSSTASGGSAFVEPGAGGGNSVWGSKYIVTKSDYELLARLVSAEAQGEPYAGQVAVAATVLRRMTDPRFPSTLSGIIYQVFDTYYYQYSPVENGTINNPAVASAYSAVNDALNGADPSNGANGFYNPAGTENTWVTQQLVTTVIGGHVFFRS
ncbi:MAG: LysM peptidoglycan-binding domain-containing protein [Chitinophagales bacterium]